MSQFNNNYLLPSDCRSHTITLFYYFFIALSVLFFMACPPECNALSKSVHKNILISEPLNKSYPVKNTITKTYTFDELGWDKSVTLNGYKPNYIFYIPIAKNLNVQKAVLHLKMMYSPYLSPQTMVNIKLNHDIIRNLSMPSDPNNMGTWDIELPLNQLAQDWQALIFSAYLYSTRDLCSPDVWIYISPESTMTLSYLEPHFDGKLNQLPYPFIDPTAVEPTPTILVLPAAPSIEEIISLFQVAIRLGELSANYKVHLSFEFINELQTDQKKQNNLLLIGTANPLFEQEQKEYQWPYVEKNNQFIDANQTPLKNNPGLLMLRQSPWNPGYGVLSITGVDHLSLKKAISAFLLSDFTSLAAGQTAIINNISVSNDLVQPIEWHHTTFKDLGFTDKSVSGLGRHTLKYSLPLPDNLIPTNLKIKTLLTYPLFQENDHAQITLLINGVKQSAMWLLNDSSSWSVEIPDDAMKPGKNTLEYNIDLHLADEHCSQINYDQIWATIHAQSILETSFLNDFPQATLNEFPVPFSGETTIIIPNSLSKNEIKELTQLFFKIGMMYQNNPQRFDIRASDQIDVNFIHSHNTILIGTPETNPWVKLLLDFVPIKIDDQERILNTPKEHLQLTDKSSVGLLELVQSPWHDKKAILLITGNNNQSLSWAIKTLANDKKRNVLNGNIALINEDQSIETLNNYDNVYIGYIHKITKSIVNFIQKTLYFIKDTPQIIIYIIVFLIPIIVYLRRRNKP